MKRLLLLFLCLLPVALFALTVGETLPSLQLTDKVLTNVTVISIAPTYITAKWDGGRGTIARSNIPSFTNDTEAMEVARLVRAGVVKEQEVAKAKEALISPAARRWIEWGYKREIFAGRESLVETFIPRNKAEKDRLNKGQIALHHFDAITGKCIYPKNTNGKHDSGPDMNAANVEKVLLGVLAGKPRLFSLEDNPKTPYKYQTGVAVPFARFTGKNVTQTYLDGTNRVVSFDGFEIPYTSGFSWAVTAPDANAEQLIPGLLASLSHQPHFTHIPALIPGTLILYSPEQLLRCTYGKDLDTVIKIKDKLGNHAPDLFWKQPFQIFNLKGNINTVVFAEIAAGVYSKDSLPDVAAEAHKAQLKLPPVPEILYAGTARHKRILQGIKDMKDYPAMDRDKPVFNMYKYFFYIPKACVSLRGGQPSDTPEKQEGVLQHELSHHLDPLDLIHYTSFCRADRYNFGRVNLSSLTEFWVFGCLLNRAHFLIYGEPITTTAQVLNLMAWWKQGRDDHNLGNSPANQSSSAKYDLYMVDLYMNTYSLPNQVIKPAKYKDIRHPLTLLPDVLRNQMEFQLGYSMGSFDIQDPELKSALLGFFAKLAL